MLLRFLYAVQYLKFFTCWLLFQSFWRFGSTSGWALGMFDFQAGALRKASCSLSPGHLCRRPPRSHASFWSSWDVPDKFDDLFQASGLVQSHSRLDLSQGSHRRRQPHFRRSLCRKIKHWQGVRPQYLLKSQAIFFEVLALS